MNSNDSWENDMLETAAPPLDQPELPRYLVELRDNTAPPQPQEGQARLRRLAKMEHDIAIRLEAIADLDRIDQHLTDNPPPCLGDEVPKAIKAHIAKLRQQADEGARRLRDELLYVRSLP